MSIGNNISSWCSHRNIYYWYPSSIASTEINSDEIDELEDRRAGEFKGHDHTVLEDGEASNVTDNFPENDLSEQKVFVDEEDDTEDESEDEDTETEDDWDGEMDLPFNNARRIQTPGEQC